jgi:hypothetical protein
MADVNFDIGLDSTKVSVEFWGVQILWSWSSLTIGLLVGFDDFGFDFDCATNGTLFSAGESSSSELEEEEAELVKSGCKARAQLSSLGDVDRGGGDQN